MLDVEASMQLASGAAPSVQPLNDANISDTIYGHVGADGGVYVPAWTSTATLPTDAVVLDVH